MSDVLHSFCLRLEQPQHQRSPRRPSRRGAGSRHLSLWGSPMTRDGFPGKENPGPAAERSAGAAAPFPSLPFPRGNSALHKHPLLARRGTCWGADKPEREKKTPRSTERPSGCLKAPPFLSVRSVTNVAAGDKHLSRLHQSKTSTCC